MATMHFILSAFGAIVLAACAGGLPAGQTGDSKSSDQSLDESFASSTDEGEDAMTVSVSLTAAGTASSEVAVGVALWLGTDALEPDRARETGEVTRRWLDANAHQLAIDLHLGAGPVVDDLAGAAAIAADHRLAFGRLLRAHRDELSTLADPATLSRSRALAFLERIGKLARAHPVLVEDYNRFARDWMK